VVNFDQISYDMAAKYRANSKHLGLSENVHLPRMLYRDPKRILELLQGLDLTVMEIKSKKVYLFGHQENSELFALIDSECGLTENEVYDSIFSANDCTGVYVREVIGLAATLPGLIAILKGKRN
jgi:hypothetical protein